METLCLAFHHWEQQQTSPFRGPPASLRDRYIPNAGNETVSTRRESIYVSDDANTIAADIREGLIQTFPRSSRLMEDPLSQICKINFQLDWIPLVFARARAHGDLIDGLGGAITFTGWSRNVQSATCLQYMRQVWPLTGARTLQFLEELLQRWDDNSHTWKLPGDILLTAKVSAERVDIIADGTAYLLAELGEQLAWVGAALRPSLPGSGIVYCKPSSSVSSPQQMSTPPREQHQGVQPDCIVRIGFDFETDQDGSEANGSCWQHLFRQAVVVKGYPILRRPAPDTGLEVPLEIVHRAAGPEGVTVFPNSLLFRALDMILVPTGQSGGAVFWHVTSSKMWKNAEVPGTVLARNVRDGIFQPCNLAALRHIIGWSSKVESYIGSSDADYHIRPSSLPRPQVGLAFDKVSISAGRYVTAGTSFAIGKKDLPSWILNDYVSRLRWLGSKYAVLYDVDDRRAWLVDGASALLHLVRASLYYERDHELGQTSLSLEPSAIQEAILINRGKKAATEVLLNPSNLSLPMYQLPEKKEVREALTTDAAGEARRSVTEVVSRSYYTFGDRVYEIFGKLQQIIAIQEDVQSKDGVGFKIKLTSRRELEGYDFMDIAIDADPIYPRVLMLGAAGQGWVDFTRAIHAITLFGRGYGELIKSTSAHDIPVPKGRDYLTVSTADLRDILELRGNVFSRPWQLAEGLYWHAPEEPFGPPRSTGPLEKDHIPVQVILPASTATLSGESWKSPSHLEPGGAVVFGHSWRFSPRRKDPGYAEDGEVAVVEEAKSVSHDAGRDSGIGSSIPSSSRPGSPFRPHLAEIVELPTDSASGPALEEVADPDDNNTDSASASAAASTTWQYEVRKGLGRLIQETFFNSPQVLHAAAKFPMENIDDGLLVEERICRLLGELIEGIRHNSDIASEVRVARILEVFKQHIAHLIAKAGGWPIQVFPISFITSLPEEIQEIFIGLEDPETTNTLSNVLLPHPAYAVFLQQLNDLASPTFLSEASRLLKRHGAKDASKLKDIVSELYHTRGPIHDVRVIDFEDPTRLDHIKAMVEDASGASWDWWPLRPPKRLLKYGEARIQWKCNCGSERYANVPRWFGHGIVGMLNQFGSAGQSSQSEPSGSNSTDISSSPSATGSGTGTAYIPLVDLGAHNDEALAIPVATEEERWIFFLVKARRYDLAQGDASQMTPVRFWRFLQDEYRRLRGWRRFFSVYVFHYCDFVCMERFRPSRFTPGDKFNFPPLNNTEYTYHPQPISPEPPISIHEFEENFPGCYEDTCLWHSAPFRWLWLDTRFCNAIRDIPLDKMRKLPKRDRRVATLSTGHSEVFWGMVARERRSFFRVCVYVTLFLLPTLVFGSGWLVGWFGEHAGDLSNAAVPATLLLALITLLWAAFWQ